MDLFVYLLMYFLEFSVLILFYMQPLNMLKHKYIFKN